jgi:hypothetical protein
MDSTLVSTKGKNWLSLISLNFLNLSIWVVIVWSTLEYLSSYSKVIQKQPYKFIGSTAIAITTGYVFTIPIRRLKRRHGEK